MTLDRDIRSAIVVPGIAGGAPVGAERLALYTPDGSAVNVLYEGPSPSVSTAAALAALETVDGKEAYFQAASGKWHLRYDLANDRWDFVGGPSLLDRQDADIVTNAAANTYSDFTDAGPAVIAPLNGSYEVVVGCESEVPVVTTNHASFMNYRRATDAMPANDIDSARLQFSGAGNVGGFGTIISPPGIKTWNINDRIEAVYRDGSSAQVVTFRKRWMRMTPRYVST